MKKDRVSKKSRFPKTIFWIVLGILLLTAGISVGLMVGMSKAGWRSIIQVHVMLLYWVSTAALLTWLIKMQTKRVYEMPLQKISAATKQVAAGDFSVRLDPIHEEEKEDYLDLMIHDLNAMIAELGSIETLKTDFVSNVSHEIKTPISVIQNYARLLQSDSVTTEEKREYSKAISDAALRLNTLITNILKLNKLENQRLNPATLSFDLSKQLTEVLLNFETVWEEHEIEIDPSIEDDIKVISDPELLAIVWNNLLSNAFKFTEPGGKVSVSLKTDGEYAQVTVADTGCGMSPETSRHIFDKFYQGDTSHATQGNGLGLALVKRIMDIVGGEVSVQSEKGKGSAFMVRLKKEHEE